MELEDEKELCARVLADEPGAADEFFARCHPVVKGALMARCTDGRSRCEAEEIAGDLIADCFRDLGDHNLLSYYSGYIPLDAWLCKVAINRLKNWWRSGRYTYERQAPESGTEGAGPAQACGPESADLPGDKEVCDLLCDAWLAACRGIAPRSLAMLRTHHLQGIPQVDIAKRWGCSPATVCRVLRKAAVTIREGMEFYLKERDAALTVRWEDLLLLGTISPEILVGFDARGARGADLP